LKKRTFIFFLIIALSNWKLVSQTVEENRAEIDEIKQQLLEQNLNFIFQDDLNKTQYELLKKKHKQKIDAELKLLNSDGIVASGELYLKINSIFDKIVKANPTIPQNTRLVLYRSNDFNAFTMGDNIIFIHIGLLNDLKNESQIALVISHEIAHNVLNHVEESMVESVIRETDKSLEKDISVILRTEYGKVSALNSLMLPRILESREKSRRHEFDADSLGLIFLKNTQFQLSDALSMFHAMEKRTKHISDSIDYKKCFHLSSIASIEALDAEYERESSLGTFIKDESILSYLATHPYDRERFYKLAKILNVDTTFTNYIPKYDENYKLIEEQIGIEMIQNSWRNKNFSEVIYHSMRHLQKHTDSKEAKEHLMLAFKALGFMKKKRIAGKYLQLQNPKFPEDFDRICAITYLISPADCNALFTIYQADVAILVSPKSEMLAIVQQVDQEDYESLEITWKENKEIIYQSNYSFILEEIEKYLYTNKKLTFLKPKHK